MANENMIAQVRYVPISAIADVATDHVTLKVDAAAVDERDWLRTPQWIAHMTGAADAKNEELRRPPGGNSANWTG